MVYEWVKVELYGANNDGDPRRYTIADGTAVSKGALMQLADERTVTANPTSGAAVAGVASEEKNADDGATSISCWTNGIFEASCSGAITVGYYLGAAKNNQVAHMDHNSKALSHTIFPLGYAMETGGAQETINVRLML